MKGYKPGDKVICTGKGLSSWFINITIGKTYTIVNNDRGVDGFFIYDDVGSKWAYDYDVYFISIEKHRNDIIDDVLNYE